MDLHSGQPFWPINDGLPAVYPTLSRSIHCEYVVLGGGITGAILAHRLAMAGRDVVVIDKREVATGSTAATTALVQYELDASAVELVRDIGLANTLEVHNAMRRGVHDLIELSSRLPKTARVTQRPTIKLAAGSSHVGALREDFELRKRAGFTVEWLSTSDLSVDYGMVRPAAVRSYDSADCDPYLLAHALLAAAVHGGARVFDRVPVRNVHLGSVWGDGVVITTETGHRVHARMVVAATGYESTQWLSGRPAALRNTYVVVSEPVESGRAGLWPGRALVWETGHPYLYMRATADGRVIAGGEDDLFRTPILRERRIERKAALLLEKVARLVPGLVLEPAYAWAGTFGETPDALPRIGRVKGRPNLFVAACYGGNGITFAMLAAELLEAQLSGRAHPLADGVRCDR